jgi:type II secretory pathway component PulF
MNWTYYLLELPLAVLLWVLFWLGPFLGSLWIGYYLMSLRMRRQERARFFLDMIETGLKDGRRPEDTIISIARSRDPSPGPQFYLLAAYLEKGFSLREALEKVPRFLSPQVSAMLQIGLRIGDVTKIFPACRQLSRDAVSQTRGAFNYLMLLAFVGLPTNIVLFSILQIYVFPQFAFLFDGFGMPNAPGLILLMRFKWLILAFQALLLLIVWTTAFVYLDGPRLFEWLDLHTKPLLDRVYYLLPWRRKRLQRDFSGMLAILLDAEVPEPEALAAAGDCTANQVFRARTQRALAALRNGATLSDAVQKVDDSGEFRWRLTQALHGHGGFFRAIAGWNESLDAKAFQEEQATAQAVTTGMVVLNGALVGLIVVSVFSALVSLINSEVLW